MFLKDSSESAVCVICDQCFSTWALLVLCPMTMVVLICCARVTLLVTIYEYLALFFSWNLCFLMRSLLWLPAVY